MTNQIIIEIGDLWIVRISNILYVLQVLYSILYINKFK